MKYTQPYIDVYHAIGGWQSKMVAFFPEDNMWDVVQTGLGPYRTREEAIEDAKCWAEYENVPFHE